MEHGWNPLPTVELLDSLVPGVLAQKGNLLKAVRLWVILRSLQGNHLSLSTDPEGWFSNAQWREAFFSTVIAESKPSKSRLRNHPEPEIRTKTLRQWLFEDYPELDEAEWKQTFTKRYDLDRPSLDRLLGSGKGAKIEPQICPFAVDDRTLRNDFATLVKAGWLEVIGEKSDRRYRKGQQFESISSPSSGQAKPQPDAALWFEQTTAHFIPNDLSSVADHFPQPINGIQRFILDVEYIVAQSVSHQVEHLLQNLKQLWQQTPVPPVRLTYRSVRYYETEFELITYPVCIYYFQRAPYLFAFGQTPQQLSKGSLDVPNWYDYRLDRILTLQPLSWSDVSLPQAWLSKASPSSRSTQTRSPHPLPRLFAEKTSAWVEQEVAAALGVEIHRPIEPLLLRFERYFYGNYIANTERAKLFAEMGFEQAEKRFQADPTVRKQGLSLAHLFRDRPRHKASIFCLAHHRLGDNNVVMRLRAWGFNVEVLLPLSLRQRMTDDMQETWKLYEREPE